MLFGRSLRSCLCRALAREVNIRGVKERPIPNQIFCEAIHNDGKFRVVAEVRYADLLEIGIKPYQFWKSSRFKTKEEAVAYLISEIHESEQQFTNVFFYLVGKVGPYIQPLEILNHPGNLYADLGVGQYKSQQEFAADGNIEMLDELLARIIHEPVA